MSIARKIGGVFKTAGQKLEKRNNRRAAEIVEAIAEALDEADAFTDLADDALEGVSNWELVIPETHIKLVRRKP